MVIFLCLFVNGGNKRGPKKRDMVNILGKSQMPFNTCKSCWSWSLCNLQ